MYAHTQPRKKLHNIQCEHEQTEQWGGGDTHVKCELTAPVARSLKLAMASMKTQKAASVWQMPLTYLFTIPALYILTPNSRVNEIIVFLFTLPPKLLTVFPHEFLYRWLIQEAEIENADFPQQADTGTGKLPALTSRSVTDLLKVQQPHQKSYSSSEACLTVEEPAGDIHSSNNSQWLLITVVQSILHEKGMVVFLINCGYSHNES